MNNRAIVKFSILGWIILTWIYFLIAFNGSGVWPEWAIDPLSTFLGSLIIGIVLGVIYSLVLIVGANRKLRRKSYGFFILFQLVIIILIILGALLIDVLFLLFAGELLAEEFVSEYFSRLFRVQNLGLFTYVILASASLTFLHLMMMKVGPTVLLNLILGKYYQPKEEERIFLFLDLRSSTKIAGKLGHRKYSMLIQDCFDDLTESIVKNKVDIYQYIGDEAVMTWKVKKGLKNAHCIKAYYDFMDLLESRKHYYLENYGLVPFFKAGVNIGFVIVTEIGVIRREIAYLSDVLHTASRIQSLCNELDKGILVSEGVKTSLEGNNSVQFEHMGKFELRGKAHTEDVYSALLTS